MASARDRKTFPILMYSVEERVVEAERVGEPLRLLVEMKRFASSSGGLGYRSRDQLGQLSKVLGGRGKMELVAGVTSSS
ncbi:hypothetical protein GCM10011390_22000 [Aureimonas endophytica]|uniref:Uncharacterized protein n=1 Tax=Aureimonas endophytica TaxID=2027858 RepID=A0A917E5Y8_9HYPH|nr:hypothetical protein GCM10011390_22000 [Aureimonas endophytica]